jgi:outer membrane lipoprotein SlyB
MASVAAAQGMQAIRYGTIVSMDPTVIEVQARRSGAQVGSTVGAVAGYALADGRDRWLGSLLGGVVGGAAGRAADKGASKKKGWQLIVKLEETGEEIGIQVVCKKKNEQYGPGDRVRLMTEPGGRTKVAAAPAG